MRYNLVGMIFGKLCVVSEGHGFPSGNRGWLCRCECGNTKIIPTSRLTAGQNRSCGCGQGGQAKLTHGHNRRGYRSGTYKAWAGMKHRCRQPNQAIYEVVSYDPAWEIFEQFLMDMGGRPKGMTLDRIENTKGYSKDNCRWATPKEQSVIERLPYVIR